MEWSIEGGMEMLAQFKYNRVKNLGLRLIKLMAVMITEILNQYITTRREKSSLQELEDAIFDIL